jgi:hypothetical protein
MSFSCSTSKGERELKIVSGIVYTEGLGFIPAEDWGCGNKTHSVWKGQREVRLEKLARYRMRKKP